MTNNEYFIQILKDYLKNQNTSLSKNVDDAFVSDMAKKQNLEGIVYYQTHIPLLQKDYIATIYNYANRNRILGRVTNAFKQNNIDYFMVKGFTIAELYSKPQLRTMGDCDIVVHDDEREKVHNILLELGFKCTEQGQGAWHYCYDGMEFEIHKHLVYESMMNSSKTETFFDTAWNYVTDNTLSWEFHFLFLLSHLRKHILYTGAGLRQFMDLAVVIRNKKLDWNLIREGVDYLEMTKFFERVLMLLKAWFDVEPFGCNFPIDQKFVDFSTDKILNGGVFGFDDEKNLTNYIIADICRRGKYVGLFGDIFCPYRDMIKMKEYAFIEGKPFLLPVAWLYRIFRKLKNIKMLKHRYKKRFTLDDAIIDNRKAYLKQWGL